MLERTATSIEPCSLQRVLPSTRTCLKTRRQLHTAFWHHGAAEFELLDACQALMRQPPSNEPKGRAMAAESNKRLETMTTSTVLLDFLYPKGAAALLRRPYSMHAMRLEQGTSSRRPMARLFTSAPSRRRDESSDPAFADDMFVMTAEEAAEEPAEEKPEDSEVPGGEQDGFSDPIALRKLLNSDRTDARDRIYQLYINLEPALKDEFTTPVLLAIASSGRPVEAWRVNELFALYNISEWTEELVKAAIKAQLTLNNVTEAMSIFRTAVTQRGLCQGLDYLVAYTFEIGSYDMVLEALALFSTLNKDDGSVPRVSVAEWIAAGDPRPVTNSSMPQCAEPAEETLKEQDVEGVGEPLNPPVPESETEAATVQAAEDVASFTAVGQDTQPPTLTMAAQSSTDAARPEAEQTHESATAHDPVADLSINSKWTYPTLAAMDNFQARIRTLIDFIHKDDEKLPIRQTLVHSFLDHLATHSITLFQPPDAVYILNRVKNPLAYGQYILLCVEQGHNKVAADLYKKYREVPGVRMPEYVLRAMMSVFYPDNIPGMEWLLEDWYRGYGRLDEMAYRKFMSFYAEQGDVKSIERLAREYAKHYDSMVRDDPTFVLNLMNAYAVKGNTAATQKVMDEAASRTGEPPTLAQFSTMLKAYSNVGAYESAINLFLHLCEVHEPDGDAFGAMMRMASRRGDLQFTLELFRLAKERNIQPTMQMMQAVVEAYCQNERFAEAERLCIRLTKARDMEGNYTQMWNTLLRHHARQRDLDTVNRLLELMTTEGVAYDHKTYSQLLLALLHCRQSHHALHLLRVAYREGVFEPTADHHLLLMIAFLRTGEPHMALRTNELMDKKKYPQTAARMARVIAAFARWQEIPRSKRRGLDAQHFLQRILREFNKVLERVDDGGPESESAMIGIYSKVLFILTQMREFATREQIIEIYYKRFPHHAGPDTIPLRLLHDFMQADFYEKKYDEVKKTWDLVLSRASLQYRTANAILDNLGATAINEESLIRMQRYRLSDPLKTMQRMYQELDDADGLIELVTTVRARGFELDSKNWNYYVQGLARLKRWRDAFSVCEGVLMPQWTGWAMVRQQDPTQKRRLPLALRRYASNPHRPRPLAHTLLLLTKEYMDLEQMALWSHVASKEFDWIKDNCPRTTRAVTTMVRSGSKLEAEIFGDEIAPSVERANEELADEHEDLPEEEIKRAKRGFWAKKQKKRLLQEEKERREQAERERLEWTQNRGSTGDDVWTDGGFLSAPEARAKRDGAKRSDELAEEDIIAALKGDLDVSSEVSRRRRRKKKEKEDQGELADVDIVAAIRGDLGVGPSSTEMAREKKEEAERAEEESKVTNDDEWEDVKDESGNVPYHDMWSEYERVPENEDLAEERKSEEGSKRG